MVGPWREAEQPVAHVVHKHDERAHVAADERFEDHQPALRGSHDGEELEIVRRQERAERGRTVAQHEPDRRAGTETHGRENAIDFRRGRGELAPGGPTALELQGGGVRIERQDRGHTRSSRLHGAPPCR